MLNGKIIEVYKKMYALPELVQTEEVDESFFGACNRKHNFAVIAIYNEKKEHLLIRDFNKGIGWELPGGYINDGESLESAINRICMFETGLEIDELEPVAIVKNIFKCKDLAVTHLGVAFIALSRDNVKSYPKNIQAHFSSSIPTQIAYQNDKILSLLRQRLAIKKYQPPYNEIESIKHGRFSFLYFLHKWLVKPIGKSSSRKIERKVLELIRGNPKTILDASCGESSIIRTLYNRLNLEICVGNDISWKTISLLKNKNPEIIFTNHNVLELPYQIVFDVVIFKNTLHHIDSADQLKLLIALRKISKQLIIIDVDDPQKNGFLSRLWNQYYVYLLGDQGDSFLSFNEFKNLCEGGFKEDGVAVGKISTIKGDYMYASIV